jgi:hypothetical protein
MFGDGSSSMLKIGIVQISVQGCFWRVLISWPLVEVYFEILNIERCIASAPRLPILLDNADA